MAKFVISWRSAVMAGAVGLATAGFSTLSQGATVDGAAAAAKVVQASLTERLNSASTTLRALDADPTITEVQYWNNWNNWHNWHNWHNY